jgi:hypothetical protein
MSNQIVISSGAKVRNLDGVLTGTSGIVNSVPLGAANGVATLDSGGKVPVSQLPSSVVTYLGTWNAATNTPTLVNGTGDAGDMYICNVAGTVNFGAGPVTFAVGDWVLYGSGTWQKSNGQNGTVTSVAVTESGDALTITGSPITTAGTINIGFAGTSGQYVNGAGGLTTFPSLAGYVTSVTATAPLLSSGGTTPDLSIPAASASVDGYLDNADWTTFNNKQNAITLTTTGTSGVSTLVGSTLNIPNYSTDLSGYVPYTGATANVNLGTFDLTADVITGATGSFASNGGSNTFAINHSSGSGIALNITKGGNGEGLYINKTSGSGNAATIIGTLNATTLVKSGGTSSQFLKADGSVDSTTYTPTTRTLTINGVGYDLSADRSWTITAGISSVSGTAPISVSTVSGAATVSIATASTSVTGALTSTDWNTFNGKQNALTNPVTGTGTNNYIPKFTTTGSTIGNSIISESGSGINIAGNLTTTSSNFPLDIYGTTNNYGLRINNVSGSTLFLYSSNVSADNRNWGLYTNSIVFGDFDIRQSNAINGDMTAGSNGTSRFYIRNNGNIIIGATTDAGYKLDVNGTGRFINQVRVFSNSTNPALIAENGSSGAFPLIQLIDNRSGATGWNIEAGRTLNTLSFRGGSGEVVTFSTAGAATFSGDITAPNINLNGLARIQNPTTGGYLSLYGNTGGLYLGAFNAGGNQNYMFIRASDGNVLVNGLSGVSGGGALQVNGNVNINGVFQINGTTIGGGGGSGVTGSGTTNFVPKWSGSTSLGNSVIQDNGSQIGIGVSPSFTLDVSAPSNNQGIRINSVQAAALYLYSTFNTPDNRNWGIFNNSQVFGDLDIRQSNAKDGNMTVGANSTSRFHIKNNGTITINGNLLLNTSTDNGYKLQINGSASFAYGFLSVYRGSSSPNDILVGNDGNRFYIGGNTYVAGTITTTSNISVTGSVTATGGFFDTSDSRLKILVKDYQQPKGIENVAARMYVKNNRKELGYFAQDLQEILPSAVIKGEDGFLTLSYTQVHTAKIAYLEDKIAQLEELIKTLL